MEPQNSTAQQNRCPFHRMMAWSGIKLPSLSDHIFSRKDVDILATKDSPNTHDTRVLEQVMNYVRGFLSRPHSFLGRSGAVCPFTEQSISKDLLRMQLYTGPLHHEAIVEATLKLRDTFLNLEPKEGPDKILKAALVIFPNMKESEYVLIDSAQSELKDLFVPHGLMAGQFHGRCDEGGVRNPDFRPLRSPVPMIAMRHMAPQDVVFLIGSPAHFKAYCNFYSTGQVPNNLKSYYEKGMNTFGYAGSSQEIHPRVFETLNASGVPYEVVGHSQLGPEIRSPEDFARAAQVPVGAVAKSILLKSVDPEALVMVVLPTKSSIDLDAIRGTLGLSSLSLVNRKDVEALTSQQMHGISPVGHDIISILIDDSLMEHPSVFVGTGRAGQELKIAPRYLEKITNARTGKFSLS